MGIYNYKVRSDYWSLDFGSSNVRNVMARQRFSDIDQMLHFEDNSKISDPLFADAIRDP